MSRKAQSERPAPPAFLDTPQGILTARGTLFSTTVPLLRDYAGRVLEYVSIEELVARAETWLRFPSVLFLWVLALGLLAWVPAIAATVAFVVYILAAVFSPPMAGRVTSGVVRVLDMAGVQIALYVAVLSYLGYRDELLAVGVGLAGFILLRWHILGFVTGPLIRFFRRLISGLPAQDQALRAAVLHEAVRRQIPLEHIEALKSKDKKSK